MIDSTRGQRVVRGISYSLRKAVELGDSRNKAFMDGLIAGGPLGPFFVQAELTADQVLELYELGRSALGL